MSKKDYRRPGLLRKLFPRDGQLRVAKFSNGRAQIQEFHAGTRQWQTYCRNEPFPNGYVFQNHDFGSFEEAKSAYESIMKGLELEECTHSVVNVYP